MRMRIKPMTADFIPPVYKTEGAAAFDILRKYGVRLLNTIGLIDYDFDGEWAVTLDCDTPCSFKRGDRILQCVIRWAARATDIEVETNRRGLESGSTGV